MNDLDMQAMFRKTELERRAARHKMLLNAAALDSEPKPPEIVEAMVKVQRAQEHYVNEVELGYWRRLWYALINRKVI